MLLLVLLWIIQPVAYGQLWDDFSDGNFTSNPPWVGDSGDFVVNQNFQLQLNASAAGISTLATAFSMIPETEWRFWIKLGFAPSDNNLARVYLASNSSNLKGPLNGYFLRFGENLSQDAIELYRQEGEQLTLICRGINGLIASAFELHIRVRRNAAGIWTIETDPTGFGAYQLDATGTDGHFVTSSWIGVYCKYTVSNIKKFYFDNFYAGPLVFDTTPPQLVNLVATGPHQVEITFDEAVLPETALNPQNYFVSDGIENPRQVQLDPENPARIVLIFDRPFTSGVFHLITIQNISDYHGNVIAPLEIPFMWFLPGSFQVLIHEIMADPDPPVGLPNAEYLELRNLTSLVVPLKGWKLIIGNTVRTFDETYLQPDGYLIVGHQNAEGFLSQFGDFYGFSGFQLTNTGQTIILKNHLHQVVHAVTYSDRWYRDANKTDGGWSLEMIDPSNPCAGWSNWRASESLWGGTPGAINSVTGVNPDTENPYLARVEVLNPISLILHFSEPLDSTLLNNPNNYFIRPDIGHPLIAMAHAPFYHKVSLSLDPSRPLSAGIFYTLEWRGVSSDCAGNPLPSGEEVKFGLPAEVAPFDIVINEILFNPRTDFVSGVDFVEIYNRSAKIIDLKGLVLATAKSYTGQITSPKNISEEGYLIFPGEYKVLTTSPEIVSRQYTIKNPRAFLPMASLPAYGNTEGTVILATRGFEVIDRVDYHENMHFPLLKEVKGVSLERIHPDRPSADPTNWHSAAESAGFATPGYQNSQFAQPEDGEDAVSVDPPIFSPDMDGYNDLLHISYHFSQPGQMVSVTIFDSRGRLIRKLVNNQLVDMEGTYSWDGINDHGTKAPAGIYVILFEVSDLHGNYRKFKKSAVLAGKL